MINWINPYESLNGMWLKGNLHAHTSPASPCGCVPLKRVLELYEKSGFDFLAISDHLQCTQVDLPTKLITIYGVEWNSRTNTQGRLTLSHSDHMGIYSLNPQFVQSAVDQKTPENVLNTLKEKDALVILNHPNWLVPHHYSVEALFDLYQDATGMEIFNAAIGPGEGVSEATMKWDRVLTEMGPFIGFASDDSHYEDSINRAWIVVNAQNRSAPAVFSAIKAGRFYCSTGVSIRRIEREGDELYCSSDQDVHIDIIGENGQIFASSLGELQYSWNDTKSSYLRFALYGPGKQQAWSQPFFYN